MEHGSAGFHRTVLGGQETRRPARIISTDSIPTRNGESASPSRDLHIQWPCYGSVKTLAGMQNIWSPLVSSFFLISKIFRLELISNLSQGCKNKQRIKNIVCLPPTPITNISHHMLQPSCALSLFTHMGTRELPFLSRLRGT